MSSPETSWLTRCRLVRTFQQWVRSSDRPAPPPDSPAGRRQQRAQEARLRREAARGMLWNEDATTLVPSGHGCVVVHRVSGMDSTFGRQLIAITRDTAAAPVRGQPLKTVRPPLVVGYGDRRGVSLEPGGYWVQVGEYPWSSEGSIPVHLSVRSGEVRHLLVRVSPGRWATGAPGSPREPRWELKICEQPPEAAYP